MQNVWKNGDIPRVRLKKVDKYVRIDFAARLLDINAV